MMKLDKILFVIAALFLLYMIYKKKNSSFSSVEDIPQNVFDSVADVAQRKGACGLKMST
jgi:hypothetical protein